jgi:hypothetical protein
MMAVHDTSYTIHTNRFNRLTEEFEEVMRALDNSDEPRHRTVLLQRARSLAAQGREELRLFKNDIERKRTARLDLP